MNIPTTTVNFVTISTRASAEFDSNAPRQPTTPHFPHDLILLFVSSFFVREVGLVGLKEDLKYAEAVGWLKIS